MAIKNTLLGGTDIVAHESVAAVNVNDTNDAIISNGGGLLGEVRMFALSMAGSVTKSTLQVKGWAICDGTTPSAQGVSSPTITTTPDLQDSFIKMSSDESSGTTGGKKNVRWVTSEVLNGSSLAAESSGAGDTGGSYNSTGSKVNLTGSIGNPITGPDYYTETNEPQHYEVAYFMKVRI